MTGPYPDTPKHPNSGQNKPMTYLLTFSGYGTHLHGDERGSWNDGAWRPPHMGLAAAMQKALVQDPYTLTATERPLVLQALREIAAHREWPLLATHVRTTHVHVVIVAGDTVERVLPALKAAATKALNLADGQRTRRRWSEGGSILPLRTPEAVTAAIRYVLESQGDPMSRYPD